MAQNFAGVQKTDDSSNEIVVRGNNPGTVLWRIEGVDVPNPNHFAEFGTSGGPLSMLNTNTIRESDFYTGAFPAEYGNAMGAAFDVRLKRGNTERVKYMAQLGFNGFEAMVDGPFSKHSDATFLFNYRNSNLTLIERMNIIDFDVHMGVPTFNDMAFKVDLPTSNAGRFSAFGLTGLSDISTEASRILKKENISEEAFENAMNEQIDEHYGSITGIYGINHTLPLGDRMMLQSGLSYTRTNSYFERDTLDQYLDPHLNYEQNFTENRLAIRSALDYNIGEGQLLKTGITYTQFIFDLNKSTFQQDQGMMTNFLTQSGEAGLLQTFAQYKRTLQNGKLTVSPGLYYQYYALNGTYSLEPRLSATYILNQNHRLNLGIGQHSQLLPFNVYFDKTPGDQIADSYPNRNLEMQKSIHYVLSHNWQWLENLALTTELYYQNLYDIPVSANGENSWSIINQGIYEGSLIEPVYMTNAGQGKNYGMDMTLELSGSSDWQALLTTSLYQSKYTGSDGIWRNTAWNGNYLVNTMIGRNINLGEHTLNLTLRSNWTGGKRYAHIDLEASQEAGFTVRDYDNNFSQQYPDYFKLDFRIGYIYRRARATHEFALDFQNITNRQNVLNEYYSPYLDDIKTSYQLDFFPVFQYRVHF